MRLLDEETNLPVRRILLLLTKEEAHELRDALEDCLRQPHGWHSHIPDAEYEREVTVAIYVPGDLGLFSERVRELIEQDR